MTDKAPFQIKRSMNAETGYDFQLYHVPSGILVLGEYRCTSPFAPKHLRDVQALLNTQAMLG